MTFYGLGPSGVSPPLGRPPQIVPIGRPIRDTLIWLVKVDWEQDGTSPTTEPASKDETKNGVCTVEAVEPVSFGAGSYEEGFSLPPLVPVGVVGEVYFGGPTIAVGYFALPDLTAEKFAQGRFRTGDLARWNAEGLLEFCGRA